jgi:hypothetical protein
MSIPKNLDTINQLLEQTSSRHVFDTNNERIVFELGFLMGLLAKLMHDDSFVHGDIKSRLEKTNKS